jgi:MFS family permease
MATEMQAHDISVLAAYSCAAVYVCSIRTLLTGYQNLCFIQGYDSIANGASLAVPSFELYFGHYDAALHVLYLDSIWTSLWSSMTGVGQIIGSGIAGPMSQKIGRRYTAIAFGAVTVRSYFCSTFIATADDMIDSWSCPSICRYQ